MKRAARSAKSSKNSKSRIFGGELNRICYFGGALGKTENGRRVEWVSSRACLGPLSLPLALPKKKRRRGDYSSFRANKA